jgi:hypothetical protein
MGHKGQHESPNTVVYMKINSPEGVLDEMQQDANRSPDLLHTRSHLFGDRRQKRDSSENITELHC